MGKDAAIYIFERNPSPIGDGSDIFFKVSFFLADKDFEHKEILVVFHIKSNRYHQAFVTFAVESHRSRCQKARNNMNKEFRRMSDAEFIAFLTVFEAACTVHNTLLKIPPEIMSDISNGIAKMQSRLDKRLSEQDAYKQAVVNLREERKITNDIVAKINKQAKVTPGVTNAIIEAMGLQPDKPRTFTPPNTPLELTAEGFSNNVNMLRWKRNGNITTTVFIIEAQIGGNTAFVQIGATTKTSFEHRGIKAGTSIVYRVKAVRDERESLYSNEAMLYRQ